MKNENGRTMKKFTLIELLVVIAIIGILISMLLPSLSKAREKTKIAVCASNQKQLGTALIISSDDYNGKYPAHSSWANWVGKLGSEAWHGGTTPAEVRVLNIYIGNSYEVAKCPSDKGESLRVTDSAYDSWGNSYLISWGGNNYGALPVTSNNINNAPQISSFEKPDRKLVLADWPWFGNRPISNAANRWHDESKRRFNVLFIDGHVEFFTFPMAIESGLGAPDPNAIWNFY